MLNKFQIEIQFFKKKFDVIITYFVPTSINVSALSDIFLFRMNLNKWDIFVYSLKRNLFSFNSSFIILSAHRKWKNNVTHIICTNCDEQIPLFTTHEKCIKRIFSMCWERKFVWEYVDVPSLRDDKVKYVGSFLSLTLDY